MEIKKIFNVEVNFAVGVERPGDQKYFVSDNSLVEKTFGWSPTIGVEQGLSKVWDEIQIQFLRTCLNKITAIAAMNYAITCKINP